MKVPDVYEFLDAVAYLRAYYEYRKKNQKSFSYESWSEELNFKSRSFLRMIVVGKKKITSKLAQSIAVNNFELKADQDYFLFLVKYSQATQAKERQVYGQKLIELIKFRTQSEVIENSDDFISDPIFPRMLSLFSYSDFHATASNFARILGLNTVKVEKALDLLSQMKLIVKSLDGETWQSHVVTFKVPDTFGSVNLSRFHQKSLEEAISAMMQPKEVRRYKSLLLPLDSEGLQQYYELLDKFSSEQVARFNSATCIGKRVYQANFNIYPVTETI